MSGVGRFSMGLGEAYSACWVSLLEESWATYRWRDVRQGM